MYVLEWYKATRYVVSRGATVEYTVRGTSSTSESLQCCLISIFRPLYKIVSIFILGMLFQVPHRDLIVIQYIVSTGRSLKLTMSSIRGLPLSEYIKLPSFIR